MQPSQGDPLLTQADFSVAILLKAMRSIVRSRPRSPVRQDEGLFRGEI
jgi:hypothetical protein